MPKITSWKTKGDGTLEESDIKFHRNKDGTYDVESQHETVGFVLVQDQRSQYTVIEKIINYARLVLIAFPSCNYWLIFQLSSSISKIKDLINVGDILVSINDRLVIKDHFQTVATLLDYLM
jgi:hypothetical protein